MSRIHHSAWAVCLVALGSAACRGDVAREERLPPPQAGDTAAADTSRIPDSVRESITLQAAPVTTLVGLWELDSDPRPRSPTRMQLTVRIDSVRSGQVFGVLARYFAGDVGADPKEFSEFHGRLADDSTLSLSIRPAGVPRAGFRFVGQPRADTVRLDVFVVGPDTLSGRDRQWMLVRQPM